LILESFQRPFAIVSASSSDVPPVKDVTSQMRMKLSPHFFNPAETFSAAG